MLWALPARWRGPSAASAGRGGSAAWRWLTDPLVATLVHGVALWVWHMPPLYDAVLADRLPTGSSI